MRKESAQGKREFGFFAVAAPGLEQIVADELGGIGIARREVATGGVSFGGSMNQLRLVNLWSRTASRVLVRMDEFHASSFHELERRAKRVDWKRYAAPGQRVRFRITCRKSRLYHSDAVAERLASAVDRQIGGITGASITGPDPEEDHESIEEEASQLFIVRISEDVCTVSADSSGELLHRRGYRKALGKAPMRETLAAAMLYGSEWNSEMPLVDPMCGSGTIAIEAALMSRRVAPGVGRAFAFESWPGHDEAAWRGTLDRARDSALTQALGPILASDRDEGGIGASLANAERAGVTRDVEFSVRAISDAPIPGSAGWMVTNPPYGARVGHAGPLKNLYAQLGKVARVRAQGYRVALLSAERSLEAQLRLNLREVFRTTNGGIPVRLMVGRV